AKTKAYQPDILFISKDRLHIIGQQKIEGAPDLVVEILSASTAYYDLKHKKLQYESSGVKEYWIVDPMEETVEIFNNVDGKFVLFSQAQKQGIVRSALLHGFEIEVGPLFE